MAKKLGKKIEDSAKALTKDTEKAGEKIKEEVGKAKKEKKPK
jgi:hypothetical protein